MVSEGTKEDTGPDRVGGPGNLNTEPEELDFSCSQEPVRVMISMDLSGMQPFGESGSVCL